MKDLLQENIAAALEDGPRLRYGTNTWVEAKAEGYVLLGGLGCMGVGRMWFKFHESHRSYPGFDDAPEIERRERDGR